MLPRAPENDKDFRVNGLYRGILTDRQAVRRRSRSGA